MSDTQVVFVVDDNEAVRSSLSLLLETAGFTAICHASAESFLAAFDPLQRGCLILDVKLRDMNGPKLHAELNRRGCTLPVIYLTAYGTIPMTVQAMRCGAVDFLTKPVNPHELLDKITAALHSQANHAPANGEEPATLPAPLQSQPPHPPADIADTAGTTNVPADSRQATLMPPSCDQLTAREREVLHMVMAGYANKTIAKLLGISYRTVELHRSHILQKTGKNNMIELVHSVFNGSLHPGSDAQQNMALADD